MDDSGITFSILSHVGTFCSIPPRCRRRLSTSSAAGARAWQPATALLADGWHSWT